MEKWSGKVECTYIWNTWEFIVWLLLHKRSLHLHSRRFSMMYRDAKWDSRCMKGDRGDGGCVYVSIMMCMCVCVGVCASLCVCIHWRSYIQSFGVCVVACNLLVGGVICGTPGNASIKDDTGAAQIYRKIWRASSNSQADACWGRDGKGWAVRSEGEWGVRRLRGGSVLQ